jgi:hypothetical protein
LQSLAKGGPPSSFSKSANAEAMKKGTTYSAIPVLQDGKTAILVRARTVGGKSVQVVNNETAK